VLIRIALVSGTTVITATKISETLTFDYIHLSSEAPGLRKLETWAMPNVCCEVRSSTASMTVIPSAIRAVEVARDCPHVSNIALGVITPIRVPQAHLKFKPPLTDLKMQVRGTHAVQVFLALHEPARRCDFGNHAEMEPTPILVIKVEWYISSMNIQQIIALLIAERNRLDVAIQALSGETKRREDHRKVLS
jgi:hypothetical protein